MLNYLYAELEGKKTGSIVGPITFGEIAYVLLNQTLVHLLIEQSAHSPSRSCAGDKARAGATPFH